MGFTHLPTILKTRRRALFAVWGGVTLVTLADAQANRFAWNADPAYTPAAPAKPGPSLPAPAPYLRVDARNGLIVASSPVVYKGVFQGTVLTISDLRLLSLLLIGRRGNGDTVLDNLLCDRAAAKGLQ